ncbi:MAG: choice-of-anchor tandem repeat GloVer-containing protein [Candidatus Cybelea sp.]
MSAAQSAVAGLTPQRLEASFVQQTRPNAALFTHLYSFKGGDDGAQPFAGLIELNGTLYGTTAYGGTGCSSSSGCGTVFESTTSGQETVLYRFQGGKDGANPYAGLVDVNGALYGTTARGGTGCSGSGGCGTVFKITTSGKETVLYSFKGAPDGLAPIANLTVLNGTLYGTTRAGGTGCSRSSGCGTVFRITTSGKETVLYSFEGEQREKDGAIPLAGLTQLKGALYGTTVSGGRGNLGTVFKITASGRVTVLYRFWRNGYEPHAGLTNVKGMLYGTTYRGGANLQGIVFEITTAGKERVVYNFKGGKDGGAPDADLTELNGTLYGTTPVGGGRSENGTVFQVTAAGAEHVIHAFERKRDGIEPQSNLIAVDGALYGTTVGGGGVVCTSFVPSGCGTIFEVTP